MPERGAAKGGRYHHGHLRSALIDTAVELIGETLVVPGAAEPGLARSAVAGEHRKVAIALRLEAQFARFLHFGKSSGSRALVP